MNSSQVLSVRNLDTRFQTQAGEIRAVDDVSFDLKKGEILGLSGQLGSGAGEVLASIAGSLKSRSGTLRLNGKKFMPKNPREAIKNKIAYCSSDRKKDGLFLGRPIFENLTSPAIEFVSR